jgi:SAM-dependent MidA family methyltransferase
LSVERWTLSTQNGNAALIGLIRDEIEKRGPVSFAWFMQQALYHPQHGYYSSDRCAIGRTGDYFTNVSVGPAFGRLLCWQFLEIWERLGKLENFVIVEQGAHDGQFAHDLLEFARRSEPEFFAALRYRIVEPFPILQERQQRTLESFRSKIEWRDSLRPFVGVHFSNELLDAFPVRLVSGGVERLVGLDGDKFVFVERPEEATAREPSQGKGAFNQAALDWIDELARNLERGYAIAIDYGCAGEELESTVQVRARHRHLDSPFEQIGYADITMQLDWSRVVERAQANGLRIGGFTDQHHFLTGIISEFGRGGSPEPPGGDCGQSPLPHSAKAKRELQTLLHPEMLGRAFQVLALGKEVDLGGPPLSGFKFARDSKLQFPVCSRER